MVRNIFILVFVITLPMMANIGKIVAIKGDAQIIRDDKKIIAKLGSLVLKNDELSTKDNTKLQLLFNDNTVITIGKNSKFKVNEYLFDESKDSYEASFGLLKGTFRTITGKIGKVAPSKFKLNSKTSSIGIRGTHILSRMAIVGDRIVCVEGEIIITHLKSGKTIILKAGEFVDVSADSDVLKAQKLTQKDIEFLDIDTRFLMNEEKEVKLEKLGLLVETPESVGWGVWNENPKEVEDLFLSNVEQGFSNVTDPDIIINATHTATYTGKVSGSHYTASANVGSYINNANNVLNMDINFGTDNITADFSAEYFNTVAGSISTDTVNGITGTVNADGSGFDLLGPNGAIGGSGTWGGTGTGTFSGPGGEYISGDLNLDDGNTEKIEATFDATSN